MSELSQEEREELRVVNFHSALDMGDTLSIPNTPQGVADFVWEALAAVPRLADDEVRRRVEGMDPVVLDDLIVGMFDTNYATFCCELLSALGVPSREVKDG